MSGKCHAPFPHHFSLQKWPKLTRNRQNPKNSKKNNQDSQMAKTKIKRFSLCVSSASDDSVRSRQASDRTDGADLKLTQSKADNDIPGLAMPNRQKEA